MITLGTIATWLASYAGGFALKFALGAFQEWLAKRQDTQAQRDIGRLTAERDQANAGRQAAEDMARAAVNAPQNVNDALARLDRGDA